MKRTLSLVLALVMVLGSFSAVFAAEEAVVNEAADFLEAVGVLEGDNGDLMLDKTLLRRDMVVLLSRLMGVEDVAAEFPADEVLTFEDITDSYYNGYIAWAVANKLIEGHDEKTFGFNENVTAQDYATVLLRAMGREIDDAAWAKALETAKELGLLADVEVENNTEIIRGEMAVMTLNALKAENGKLAEELGIELPKAPEATKVEDVYAENRKEVVVVFDGEVDATSAEEKGNYSIKDFTIDSAVLSEDLTTVTLTLDEDSTFANQTEYELTVSKVKAGDKTVSADKVKFVVLDNTLPEIVEVKSLGTKAIKVYVSEPVNTVSTSNFKLDGKSFFGTATKDGRVITLKPYNSSTVLTAGDHTLEISGIVDFNDFKSLKQEFDFTVVEDNDAPVVVDYTATLEKVVLTFDEDIDPDTVKTSNFYWLQGSTKQRASNVEVSENKITLDFTARPLPAYEVTLVIDAVADYSGNKLDKAEVAITAVVDQTRPTVLDVEVEEDNKTINVKFDKNVNGTNKSDYVLKDSKDKKVSIKNITTTDSKNFKVNLYSSLDEGIYSLEISGVADKTALKNAMLPQTFELEVKDGEDPYVSSYSVSDKTVIVNFSEEMKNETIGDPSNYLVKIDDSWMRLPNGTELTVLNNGKSVRIIFPNKVNSSTEYDLQELQVIGAEDLEGNLVKVNVANNPMNLKATQVIAFANYSTNAVDKDVYAKLTDDKTLNIRFNQAIGEVKTGGIVVKDVYGKNVAIDSIEVDGTSLVVVNFKDSVGTDTAKLVDVKVIADKLVTLVGEELAADMPLANGNIKDVVKPEVEVDEDAEELVVTGTSFNLTFTEDLKVNALVAQDLKVIREVDAKVLVADVDFTAEVVNGNEIKITITAEKGESFYTAQVIDGARYIQDTTGNTAVESDVLGTATAFVVE